MLGFLCLLAELRSPVQASNAIPAEPLRHTATMSALQAISSNECVPDALADSRAYEDYAQMSIVWIFQHAIGAHSAQLVMVACRRNPSLFTSILNFLGTAGALPAPGGYCMRQLTALSQRLAPGMKQFQTRADQGKLSDQLCSPEPLWPQQHRGVFFPKQSSG